MEEHSIYDPCDPPHATFVPPSQPAIPPATNRPVGSEEYESPSSLSDEQLAAELLMRCVPGWSLSNPHNADTPRRFVQSLREMGDPSQGVFKFTTFDSDVDEMITLSPIPFYTLCAHHVVPFFGQVYIGYVPAGKIAGLSKFARAVKYVAKGLWVQEDLTAAVHGFLQNELTPRGLAVQMRAEHMCMAMRGVQTPGVITTTSKMSGVFADHTRTAKAEFLAEIGRT